MIYGFLNINKPKGITSFDVIRRLRLISGIKKMGHLGTLDPIAEGVLVVAVAEATKLIEFLMKADKSYKATMVLGATSSTYDADGQITPFDSRVPELDEIEKHLKCFMGEIDQIPPKYSAIKINGKKAYDLARKGEEFEMKSRKITIDNIKILEYNYPNLVINVDCGSGTYIRSLIHDLGQKLGTGAYMSDLNRTRVGKFKLEESYNLDEIEQKGIEVAILPLEKIAENFPSIDLSAEEVDKLGFGQTIFRENAKKDVEIFSGIFNNKLVGILEKVQGTQGQVLKFKKKLNIDS
ncbi:tRNA pseudouridine(55) synthase TruB [Patescibacteria group bacterium]|nr:tRNA pseudouridine(55) synthase TruB [Patescibacteria group bacterium]